LIQLIQLKEEDTNNIADIHIAAFPGFFLTALGKDVLRVFYRSLFQDKSTIVWGVSNEQKLIGFFVASTKSKGLYTRIFIKHFLNFLTPLTISFLKNINLLKKMITSVNSVNYFNVPLTFQASLLSICVSPNYAGKGIGKLLLNKLENELKLQKQTGYYLTTDAEKNEATNSFYLNYGFQLHDIYRQDKRIMNIYVKYLK
jgi:ribosomal protein S18 acetylase RimI-like enzyme